MWQPKTTYSFSSQLSNYIPTPYRRAVFKRDGNICQFCGKTINLGLCHLIPKSRGGKTEPNNLVVVCQDCQRKKGRLTPLEFINEQINRENLKVLLEEKNILEGAMKVKVIYLDGSEETGEVDKLPSPSDHGFYFHPQGNGKIIFISMSAVKKIVQGV